MRTYWTLVRRELAEYQDGKLPLSYRRHAAVILVSLARRRGATLIRRGLAAATISAT